MRKLKLSQAEIDKLVVVERRVVRATVCRVGYNDSLFQPSIKGKVVWQYELWKGLIKRTCDNKHRQGRPSYQDVTCCSEWLSFSNFVEWVNKEVDYKGKPVNLELDKDLIIRGNRVYSPATCSFVPQEVNKLLSSGKASRGKYPVGVVFNRTGGRLSVSLGCDGEKRYLGLYDTPEEAFAVYKAAKEAHVKVVADRYKEVLKPEVYNALMAWEVDIFS